MKVLILIALVASTNAGILSALPSVPSLGSGGMSYLEILRLCTSIYNSPIGKYMPPVTEMITIALQINQASKTANESWTKITETFKDTADKVTAQIQGTQPSTFNITSIFNSLPKPSSLTNLLPAMPSLPSLPSVPASLPSVPSLPSLPSLPSVPSLSSAPSVPSLSSLHLPSLSA